MSATKRQGQGPSIQHLYFFYALQDVTIFPRVSLEIRQANSAKLKGSNMSLLERSVCCTSHTLPIDGFLTMSYLLHREFGLKSIANCSRASYMDILSGY